MFFAKSLVTLLAAASSALALTINTPSGSDFWVQNTSNTITWSFSSSDPNPVDITVTNSNSSFLNGAFSIARGLDLSNGSFTVTNVTLVVASGYVVNFVNSSNETQVFASSQPFQVMPPGTAAASVVLSSAASTATSASGSAASSGSSTASAGSSASSSAAMRAMVDAIPVIPIVISAGMAIAGGLLTL